MSPGSPHYHFHPESIGWLHRRHERGEEITKADLARLLRADPSNGSDALLQDYLIKALENRLPKKPGRKPMTFSRRLRLEMAAMDVEERTAELWVARQRGEITRMRGDLEPCVQAADEVGPAWGLPGGRSLLNAISALKTGRIAMNDNRCRA